MIEQITDWPQANQTEMRILFIYISETARLKQYSLFETTPDLNSRQESYFN